MTANTPNDVTPIFLDEDDPNEPVEIPTYITTQTSVDTLGLRPGETLQDAIDRNKRENNKQG